ncbi:MAG: DinB family protein [Actinomycetota bacterium]
MDRPTTPKDVHRRYLDVAHDAVRWKLDGLSEYDLRRPLTPTGTTLLGVMKHLAWVELGYFGEVFDRPSGVDLMAFVAEPNGDMYARADESVDEIRALFDQAQRHAHETLDALDLASEGHVPWWGDANPVTLQWICVHMVTEIHRHLGQLDILREGIDGSVGMREGSENLPDENELDWPRYVADLQRIAEEAATPEAP